MSNPSHPLPALTQLVFKLYRFYTFMLSIFISWQGCPSSQTAGLPACNLPLPQVFPSAARILLLKPKHIPKAPCWNFSVIPPNFPDNLSSFRPGGFLRIGVHLLQVPLALDSPKHILWKSHTGPEFQELFFFVPSTRKSFLSSYLNWRLPIYFLRSNLRNTATLDALLSPKPTSTHPTRPCVFYYLYVFPTWLYIP